LHFIEIKGPVDGLFLNLGKCSIWWHEALNDWTPFPPNVKRVTEGMTVLGSPLGTDAFVSRFANKVDALCTLLEKVAELNVPQIELLLLRFCTRINHLMKTCRLHAFRKQLESSTLPLMNPFGT
jgi:hypothetical protein